MGWVKPTAYEDPSGGWSSEANAYDGEIGTFAQEDWIETHSWSSFLILKRAVIFCNKVRFYCAVPNEANASIDIDIRRDGVWEHLYQGTFTAYEWVEKSFADGNIDAMKIRLYNPSGIYERVGRIFEVEFLESVPAVPTVVTNDAREITLTGAELNGEVTALYPAPCDERGFEWGTVSGVYPYSWTETGGFGTGVFSHDLTGLEEDTTYYYRAKAHNAEGWGYGAEQSFGTGQPTTTEMDVRLTSVDPPDPEPKRTIYRDIVNLPDPVLLGMTIRYFNHDDVGLYMQITGAGAGYTFGTVNLGLLGSGANAYRNLDEFASRAKPSVGDLTLGEMEENVTLILSGYTDAGYSDLKWTFERVVTVHWINSADAAFTVDFLNNFADGTIQGWAVKNRSWDDYGGGLTIAVATDYVLSVPYSLKGSSAQSIAGGGSTVYSKCLRITKNTDILVQLGYPVTTAGHLIPPNRWLRIVVPLPKNTTVELNVELMSYGSPLINRDDFCLYKSFATPDKPKVFAIIDVRLSGTSNTETPKRAYMWLDDFKIISK